MQLCWGGVELGWGGGGRSCIQQQSHVLIIVLQEEQFIIRVHYVPTIRRVKKSQEDELLPVDFYLRHKSDFGVHISEQ